MDRHGRGSFVASALFIVWLCSPRDSIGWLSVRPAFDAPRGMHPVGCKA